MADRSLLDSALSELNSQSIAIPPEVISAIRSLEVKKWVYLRDTKSHSVFIDPSGKAAFGALGLTQRIQDIIAYSGALIEIGLVCYFGRYVTDDIVSHLT